jgi:hypothetical protein
VKNNNEAYISINFNKMGQNNVNTNNTNKDNYASRKLDYNKPENRRKLAIERDYVLKNNTVQRKPGQI